ncbi:MAG: hypothetical protein JO307_07890 [Bryobacterales bacterium]|nr:hypothetical protein [Bryobacterales bacterium]MBV9397318.1 hypothetical protein [Bryobacterales bacterium]
MEFDRRAFFAGLGGAGAVMAMTHEARADALEDFLMQQLNEDASHRGDGGVAAKKFPTAAEIDARIETQPFRRGLGNLFRASSGNVKHLAPLPAKPTLVDFFKLRFSATSNHVLQSANRAMRTGQSEEVILACLLHDTVQELIKVDHGWWGAQMYEPYVSEKVAFAIRYHQALRFYEDTAHGYVYPDLYRNMFGEDYKPEPYIEATYKMVRNHKWYLEPRMVTVNDLYAFEPGVHPQLEQFTDIIGRHFKQPKEGLGFDNSPVAHMWRSMAMPDHPL